VLHSTSWLGTTVIKGRCDANNVPMLAPVSNVKQYTGHCLLLDLNRTVMCQLSGVRNKSWNVIILAEFVGAFDGKRGMSTVPSAGMIEGKHFYNHDATLCFHHNLFQQKHEWRRTAVVNKLPWIIAVTNAKVISIYLHHERSKHTHTTLFQRVFLRAILMYYPLSHRKRAVSSTKSAR